MQKEPEGTSAAKREDSSSAAAPGAKEEPAPVATKGREGNPSAFLALAIVAQEPAGGPICTACGMAVDPVAPGTRLMSKKQQSYRCGRCNTMSVSLHRTFGQWPLPQFRELSKTEQQDFFRSAGSDSKSLESAVHHLLSRRLVERSHSQTTGKFLPLSVWAQKGYDPAVIERDGQMEMHPVLGPTYQVVLKETGRSKWEELAREQVLELKKQAKSARGVKASGDPRSALAESSEPPFPAEAAKESNSSEDDSSSSDTSSSSKHKRKSKKKKHRSSGSKHKAPSRKKDGKRGKKGKKDGKKGKKRKHSNSSNSSSSGERQKKKAKAQKEEDAARQRAVRKIHTDATKVISKISSLVGKLEEIVAHPSAVNLPTIAVQRAKDQSKALTAMFIEARNCLSSGSPKPLSFELEAVGVLCREAMETKTSCGKLLATVNRLT